MELSSRCIQYWYMQNAIDDTMSGQRKGMKRDGGDDEGCGERSGNGLCLALALLPLLDFLPSTLELLLL